MGRLHFLCFEDLTKERSDRRRQFSPIMKILWEHQVKHTLAHPANLRSHGRGRDWASPTWKRPSVLCGRTLWLKNKRMKWQRHGERNFILKKTAGTGISWELSQPGGEEENGGAAQRINTDQNQQKCSHYQVPFWDSVFWVKAVLLFDYYFCWCCRTWNMAKFKLLLLQRHDMDLLY